MNNKLDIKELIFFEDVNISYDFVWDHFYHTLKYYKRGKDFVHSLNSFMFYGFIWGRDKFGNTVILNYSNGGTIHSGVIFPFELIQSIVNKYVEYWEYEEYRKNPVIHNIDNLPDRAMKLIQETGEWELEKNLPKILEMCRNTKKYI